MVKRREIAKKRATSARQKRVVKGERTKILLLRLRLRRWWEGGGAGARAEESGLGFEKFRFGFGLESLSSLLPLLFGSLGSFVGHGHSRCGRLQQ
ncbi:Hypothetical predicted protein [Olea europaea subsp. europaea]|uniref:Uncharacterized protein n=1 Tax=Olea europaea subsp. europaea TaxID=158383 RepID=A0A8S0U3A8_OLEEU|nr:Hypothetical predicted protein [Olea europaea subsp. europaea]